MIAYRLRELGASCDVLLWVDETVNIACQRFVMGRVGIGEDIKNSGRSWGGRVGWEGGHGSAPFHDDAE